MQLILFMLQLRTSLVEGLTTYRSGLKIKKRRNKSRRKTILIIRMQK